MEPYIETYTGRKFWPLNPRKGDIFIEDIAHALSLKCRYTGHCRVFYSVAEHSVRMAIHFLSSLDHPPRCSQLALAALMHDAAEAYLPDIAAPLKPHMTGFDVIEARVEKVISEKFGVLWPWPSEVKLLDKQMLLTEAHSLMPSKGKGWEIDGLNKLEEVIRPWDPGTAEREFLMLFEALCRGEGFPITLPPLSRPQTAWK